MTWRAAVLGLAVGLAVASLTYLNDVVARQAQLIGHFFPLGVVGLLLIVAIVLNPVLARLGWAMRGGELAVAAAVAFAACGWPGAGFYRAASTIVVMPRHWEKVEPGWQAQHALSYVPHGDPALAEGHVRDWPRLLAALGPSADGGGSGGGGGGGAAWYAAMDPAAQRLADALREAAAAGDVPTPGDRRAVLGALNRLIVSGFGTGDARDGASPIEARWASRRLLQEAFPDALTPPPRGEPVLLPADRPDALASFAAGGADTVPWSAWRPVVTTWAPVALGLAVCAFCLSLIVHPQWSRHELLAYPIARFVDAIAGAGERGEGAGEGAGRPLLASPGFWVALAAAGGIHLLNGMSGWVDGLPSIPLRFDFTALHVLFPQAAGLHELTAYTRPTLLLSVVGFSFFLSGTVSLSLGMSQLLYVILAAWLLSRGVSLSGVYGEPTSGGLLRFGAYLAFAGAILYLGRRFYAAVGRQAVGLGVAAPAPGYAVWAARGLAVAAAASVGLLMRTGLGWDLSLLLVLMVLLTVLVLSRVVAETGAFFLQPSWLPFTVLASLVGPDALGPTGFVLFALGSILLIGDPRETLMPFLVNAWRIADRPGGSPPGRVAPVAGVMVLLAFLVAGVVTLSLQHRWGVIGIDRWTNRLLPSLPFDVLSRQLAEMAQRGTLAEATAGGPGLSWSLLAASPGAWGWVALGAVLVVAAAAARLRLPWWPLHPVIFVVWGTWPMTVLAASFLVGYVVKQAVLRLGGATAYRAATPIMVGLVAGELLGALVWACVGLASFLATGVAPPRYTLF